MIRSIPSVSLSSPSSAAEASGSTPCAIWKPLPISWTPTTPTPQSAAASRPATPPSSPKHRIVSNRAVELSRARAPLRHGVNLSELGSLFIYTYWVRTLRMHKMVNLISFVLLLVVLLMQHGLWSSGASDKNKAMVEQLQRYGVIRSSRVAEVMEAIDRGLFVPAGASPYYDSPMPIGYNATISAPHMHASCLELLEKNLQPGMRALDVGSGTGYLTACFALMVGSEGRAVGVEHIPELVASSIENIKKSAAAPQLNDGSLSIHVADGREGWPDLAPYDAIHVGAAAPQIPEALIKQLKPGGRMVIPVGTVFQELKVLDKKLDGSVSIRDETSVRYVPLTSKEAQLHAN